ncbi:hypothetical protein C0Z01_14115 [Photobacterium kishitanii]|uniref:hypothetical protein n=1 Tax=Photobacterium kishitanii TaxID=318456 RepID=UPI0007EF3A21|nr:hypothetical protein [Photobacterium kishitanii]OBU24946.1 hypothetical protein AYY22_20960 [Photobacterium kishitanii]PSW68692.1 hypothetical protein C0Z01_14115 [Photobacterium kishitanii]
MLNIKPYNEDSYNFYKSIVNSKRKPEIKAELDMISSCQADYFGGYDTAFKTNSLTNIQVASYDVNIKNKLKSLYSYRNKKIKELKNALTKHPLYEERILNTCQNCTINEVDTMDHVLGQSEFPEFAVHPKNLFPCCSVCNKKKSDAYTDTSGSRLFLNLFLDDLPKSQYLYVDFDENWFPSFRLDKPKDVRDDDFKLIGRHYDKLDLLTRFNDNSNEIISTILTQIRLFGDVIDADRIGAIIKGQYQDLEPILGYNHRQVIIYRKFSSDINLITKAMGV